MPISRILCTFGALIMLASTSYRSAWAELKEVALVMGNSAYQNVPYLPNPGNDATLLAHKLELLGFTIVGGKPALDLTRKEMNKALADFVDAATDADVSLIYYAGHGVQVNEENYLIPIDADPMSEDDIPTSSLSAASVLKALSLLHTHLNFLILDACRDNPFATRSLFRSMRGPTAGLAPLPVTQGTIIWYATEPGKKAWDGRGKNGPYAKAISQYITIKNLDVYGLFNLSGSAVFNEVFKKTKKHQLPWLAASVLSADYYFSDSEGRGAFKEYTYSEGQGAFNANDLDDSLKPPPVASSMFASGISVPGRTFMFGQSYRKVNSLLDSSFQIYSWKTLPRAGEYDPDDIRYFWVNLSALPVVQSAIANLSGNTKCIDPRSYIAFFFKNREFFHSSVRLYKSNVCSTYDWVRTALFPPNESEAVLSGDEGDVTLVYHDIPFYSVLEITKKGVASEQASIIGGP